MEKQAKKMSGWVALPVLLALLAFVIHHGWKHIDEHEHVSFWLIHVGGLFSTFYLMSGLVTLDPNQSLILMFMGKYKGRVEENGFWYLTPWYGTEAVSLRINNYSTEIIKVNDKNGSPIEAAALVEWRVEDAYLATFETENLEEYVKNQTDTELRKICKSHTYTELSNMDVEVDTEMARKAKEVGVRIVEIKLTHLVYSPDIASAMLQKQQASAMNEAREIIVSTAVDMAKNAANQAGIPADKQHKFIQDLVLVLCSDKGVTPLKMI